MKKKLSLLLVIMMISMLLFSCGGNPLEGVWKVDNLDPDAPVIHLKENGELVTTRFFGDEFELAGNYSTDSENKMVLSNATYGEQTYVYNNSGMSLELIKNDEVIMSFDKSSEREGYIRMIIGMALGFTVNIINDYAIAVIVFTIILKVILLPISINQTKSTVKMNKVSPIVAKINEKYKHDKQKAQQKTMELYQKAKINPLAGCLPMILNMMILIGFFRVMLYPEVYIYSGGQSIIYSHPGLLEGSFLWIKNLSQPDLLANIPLFGNIIPESMHGTIPGIMPIMTAAVTLFSFNTMATPQQPGQNNAMMTSMKFVMPLMFLFLGAKYPAALMVYWTVSSIFQMIQQPIIKKLVDKEVA